MTFNVNEVNKEVKETKELSPIIEFLKEFEDKLFYGVECDREIPDKEFYIKTAKELKTLIKPEIKGGYVIRVSGEDCQECGDNTDLYKLEGWEDNEGLCRICFCEWLIKEGKKIC